MTRRYVIKYHGFRNVYTLEYTETKEQFEDAIAHGFERITRKEAEHICAEENSRRKWDRMFSGFGGNRIYPYGVDHYPDGYVSNGYIMERIVRK